VADAIEPDDDLDRERDTMLLKAILDRPDGDILSIIQVAWEVGDLPRSTNLRDRLAYAYYEITGEDGGGDDMIRLRDPDE
jgi:hypothetical protein